MFRANTRRRLELVPSPADNLIGRELTGAVVLNLSYWISRNWNHRSIVWHSAPGLNSSYMKHANTLDDPENYPFGQQPARKRSGLWKWAIALALAGLFVYRSTRPVMRLSAEPPPAFYGNDRTLSQQERQHQRRLALAYWSVAVRRIQAYYSPQKPLPAEPPPQFRISDAASPLEADLMAGRVQYWNRLRNVWEKGDAWVVSYGWNTDWVERGLNSIPRFLPRSVTGVIQSFINFFTDLARQISFH